MANLLALLLCERATFNTNEKLTLHGLFDGLRIPRLNGPSGGGPEKQTFYVFYKVVSEAPCTISLRIGKPSGEHIDGEWVDSVALWAVGGVTWQSIWALTTDLFEEPGLYTLELLWSDGTRAAPVGQTQLVVEYV